MYFHQYDFYFLFFFQNLLVNIIISMTPQEVTVYGMVTFYYVRMIKSWTFPSFDQKHWCSWYLCKRWFVQLYAILCTTLSNQLKPRLPMVMKIYQLCVLKMFHNRGRQCKVRVPTRWQLRSLLLRLRCWRVTQKLWLARNWVRNIRHCIHRVIVPTRWLPRDKGWQPLLKHYKHFFWCVIDDKTNRLHTEY